MSKLESLPNEILICIFEKYINGVDIIVAFAYQQNQRFDSLIGQCQRYYFNFLHCRKDSFRVCIGLLPAYVNKIEELILSDLNTPGQIYAFLSVFTSFIDFKQLRKFYIHINPETVHSFMIATALRSLFHTPIDTIIIKVLHSDDSKSLGYLTTDMIRLPTIRRLFTIDHIEYNRWSIPIDASLKIEYLTDLSMSCKFQQLQSPFQCIPHLKYFNVRLTYDSYYGLYHSFNPLSDNITSMPTLHTLILSFEREDVTTFDMLAQYLKAIPVLRRLDIKAHRPLVDANAWETLLQTSLPLLTHFTLKTTTSRINDDDIKEILASFETPFWITKKNFYMTITKHKPPGGNRFGIYKASPNDADEFSQPVIQWWIVPLRARIDDIPTNDILSLGISGVASSLSQYHYFRNVKQLVVYNLDPDLLKWFVTYVNYSHIKYLDISHLDNESSTVTSLLSHVRNIDSLRIQYNHLLTHRSAYSEQNNRLKYLDISVVKHSFDIQNIIIISKLFPYIEHLVINTKMLWNIPLLKTYLPHLCSLTFTIIDSEFSSYNTDQKNSWENKFRQKVEFLFQREDNWITIWIDQAALEESYWQKFNSMFDRGKSLVSKIFTQRLPFSK